MGAEHIEVIRKFFSKLPDAIDYQTREEAEKDLGRLATEFGPAELGRAADRLAYVLDQDGPAPTDADRARRRYFTIGRQRADGMTHSTDCSTPRAARRWRPSWPKRRPPGCAILTTSSPVLMSNHQTLPREPISRAPQPQRNHDALTAMGRAMLASGQLGQHNGLPATIIVSTTLKDLESVAGHGVTASGSLLPMADVIRMASHAYHYLVIFDEHKREPLYLGRSKRLASRGQRIVLHARDRGCTFPGCTVPGYGCQVHHAKRGWARGGQTNVDEEVLACPPHNRLVEKAGWSSRHSNTGRRSRRMDSTAAT